MYQIPEIGFLRLKQIIGDPKAKPPIPPLIPVKKTAWWAGVASGRFPKGVKLGPRLTVWPVESIRAYIESLKQADTPSAKDAELAKVSAAPVPGSLAALEKAAKAEAPKPVPQDSLAAAMRAPATTEGEDRG